MNFDLHNNLTAYSIPWHDAAFRRRRQPKRLCSIFRALLPYYGKLVTPKFFQNGIPYISVIKKINTFIKDSIKPIIRPAVINNVRHLFTHDPGNILRRQINASA